jgi:hypothetical protein
LTKRSVKNSRKGAASGAIFQRELATERSAGFVRTQNTFDPAQNHLLNAVHSDQINQKQMNIVRKNVRRSADF